MLAAKQLQASKMPVALIQSHYTYVYAHVSSLRALNRRQLIAFRSTGYIFQLFALDRCLGFTKPPSLKMLLKAMQGSVVARARLDGFFEQK
jgi:hypothetical protein